MFRQNSAAKRHYDKHGKGQAVCEKCGKTFTRRSSLYTKRCPECNKPKKKFLNIPQCLESASRKVDKNIGYVRVYAPMHSEANTWGYVYEHRLIAEQKIGRLLQEEEVVHHINGIRWDNRPENLQVMNRVEHDKLTLSTTPSHNKQ